VGGWGETDATRCTVMISRTAYTGGFTTEGTQAVADWLNGPPEKHGTIVAHWDGGQ
jgi:hypothetical protein